MAQAFHNPHQHTIQSGWISIDLLRSCSNLQTKQQGSGSRRGTCSHFRELSQACFQHSSGLKGCFSSAQAPTSCVGSAESTYTSSITSKSPRQGMAFPNPHHSSLLLNPIKSTVSAMLRTPCSECLLVLNVLFFPCELALSWVLSIYCKGKAGVPEGDVLPSSGECSCKQRSGGHTCLELLRLHEEVRRHRMVKQLDNNVGLQTSGSSAHTSHQGWKRCISVQRINLSPL